MIIKIIKKGKKGDHMKKIIILLRIALTICACAIHSLYSGDYETSGYGSYYGGYYGNYDDEYRSDRHRDARDRDDRNRGDRDHGGRDYGKYEGRNNDDGH